MTQAVIDQLTRARNALEGQAKVVGFALQEALEDHTPEKIGFFVKALDEFREDDEAHTAAQQRYTETFG